MSNGPVVIERLEFIKRSLNRAIADIDEELSTRRVNVDYKEVYVHKITDLVDQTNRLEDLIHKITYGIY